MSYFIKHLSNYKTILCICLILVSVQLTHAQLVTGPSPVNPNSTHTYYHDTGTTYSPKLKWTATGGTALSGGITGTNYHVNVQWGAAGTGTIVCKSGLILLGGKTVTIGTGPFAPPAPEISKFPGYTRLIRTTPPAGEIWYWQSSASGTSTADPSYYIDRPYGTTSYYLRAYVSSSNTWSPATLVTYTVDPYAPSMDTNLSDENYVHTVVPRKRTTNLSNISNAHKMETVTYFDGLGRAVQSIGIRAGGDNEDIITHIDYDDYGRQDKEYLPYALSTNYGGYKTNALSATNTFYDAKFGSSSYPYSEKNLEDSPISRVTQQGAPGSDWRIGGGHEIEFDYQVNTGSEVRRFEVATSASVSSNITTYNPTLSLDTGSGNNNGNYEAGTLHKTVTKDENYDSSVSTVAHTTEEFKDQQGRVILKRTYGTSKIGTTTHTNVAHDTYYLYDEYGNLTYVLPPKMDASTATLSTINSQMNDLGYQYKYDDRNRLVEKRIPGKEWEYIVYNKLDRLIMTQDKNLRDDNDWLFTTYDDFGRVAYTGMVNKNWSRQAMQNHLNTGGYSQTVDKRTLSITLNGTTLYYENYFTNGAYIPTSSVDVFTINYYDDYTYDGFSSMPEISGGQVVINHDNAGGTRKLTKGLATGSKVRVLDSSPVEWITTTMGYDENGRTIYVKSVNDYLGTTDIVENVLDFTGAVDKTMTSHTKGSVNVITEDVMTYDHMGRLTKQTQELDNTDVFEVIVENTYDDLGQLESKDVGGQTTQNRLQTVDYTYNIRGWLKQINNPASLGTDLFAFKINYNTEDHNATKLYNGNISEVEWKTANTDSGLKWYKYSYDALNRITNATDDISRYSLSNLTYDKNGNIMTLNRAGHKVAQPVSTNSSHFATNMDILSYVYESNSNKLKSVNDTGYESYGFKEIANNTIEYDYDSNGNMTKDDNKGITSIEYNHLNLPTKVYLPSGNISYFYDATGVKLKKVVSNGGTTTEYAGNYVYEGSSLKFFNHPEGYIDASGSGYEYVYQYKDHLGNVRLSYQDSDSDGIAESSEILEENNYYPFGLKHKGYNNNPVTNHKYELYNGVEYEESLGLNLYEMDFRQYDPAIARFTGIDPVTHHSMSTYTAFDNNPVFWADPSGADSGNYDHSQQSFFMSDFANNYNGGHWLDYARGVESGSSGIIEENIGSSKKTGKVITGELQEGCDDCELCPDTCENNVDYKNYFSGKLRQIERLKQGGLTYVISKQSVINLNTTAKYGSILSTVWGVVDINLATGTYLTTAGVRKDIWLQNGKVRSARAGAFATQYKLARFGSYGLAGFGIAIDGIGVYNYYANPNDPTAFTVSPGRAGTNLFFTGVGIWGGPPGWVISGLYFGVRYLEDSGYLPEHEGSTTCFIAGTKILMGNGGIKNIEDIVVGDKILSVDISKMKIETDIVVALPSKLKKYKRIKARFSNGIINEFSPAHPFWVKDKGWSVFDLEEAKKELNFDVNKLEIDDIVLYYMDGILVEHKIISLEDTGEFVEMYNLEHVKKNFTFFANGILVHNKLGY